MTYWYSNTDGVTTDALCERHGLDRFEFRRMAARIGRALPDVDQGTFDQWCVEANVTLKQHPPTPGLKRADKSGHLAAGRPTRGRSPRKVAAVTAGAGSDIRSSVIHQVKGEQADAVLVVIPDDNRTAAVVGAWTSGDHPPEVAENLRALYVATTRARRLLAFALPDSVFETVRKHLNAEGVPTRTGLLKAVGRYRR
ncbi:hypothetical protein GCM10009676_39830 [Prauserella halophila]|uniref:DNA helicase n=1 Tax=Prauserella halophila TaxID=185641 RepID=A0ABN1WH31_9PSEU|nr:ATP-binding domain-containing protein [Prauserella halophila]